MTDDFLDLFPGFHCFRAYWPTKGPLANRFNTPVIVGYGEHWEFEPELRRLNALGYGIYFTVNDTHGRLARKEDIRNLRCIYQECDDEDFALVEPSLAGRQAHMVVESSPGKRHRYWLTDPLPVTIFPHIQQKLRELYWHDHGAEGEQRVLRVPGYLNTQYAAKPLCHVVRIASDLTPLTEAEVTKEFFGEPGDPNSVNALEGIQRSGDRERATVIDLNKARAKRAGGTDAARETDLDNKANTGTPSANLTTSELLTTLSRIDPDCGYNEWLRCVAALHWMSEGGEWGEDIADRWSGLGHSYKAGAFKALWRSLKADHAKPTHWGTLKGRAAATKPDDPQAIARRLSPAFKAFEAAYPNGVPARTLAWNWPDRVITADGRPIARINSPANARYLLENLGMRLSYDSFKQQILINGKDQFEQHHLDYMFSEAHEHKWDIGIANLDRYCSNIARAAVFNEPLSYFEGLRGKWDGVERLRTVGQRLLGIKETGYEGQTIELMLVAVVRRVMQPGVKYDLMPIFEGDQGLGKTTFLKKICPREEWYNGSLKLDEEAKRLYQLMQGHLIVEFAELSGKAEARRVKQLLTQSADSFVANYDKRGTTYNRIACWAGSTNEINYLRDTTGNRRFPPLIVTKKLDWAALDAEREQLWAEAVWLEGMGDLFYETLTLPDDCFKTMEKVQEGRLDLDAQVLEIVNELDAFEAPVVQDEAIWHRLGLPHEDRKERTRHKNAMRQIKDLLKRRGWKLNESVWVAGKTIKGHFKPVKHKKRYELICNGHTFVKRPDQEEIINGSR